MEQFEQLYRDNYKRIYAFLYRLCRNVQTAEDLTQETFYQAYVSLHRFKGDSEIFTWLASIAKHMYMKYLRKNHKSLGDTDLTLIAETYCTGYEDSPDAHIERQTVIEAVRRVIKKLPQKYADVVMLRVYSELSFAQVAKVIGITENSAKVIYCRAKKMLSEELEEEFKNEI